MTARAGSDVDKPKVSAWVTYWDADSAFDEVLRLGNRLSRISLFAAYYRADDSLFVPEEISQLSQEIMLGMDKSPPMYLTVVNDLLQADKAASLKDRPLLWRKFGDADSRAAHAKEIIAAASDLGAVGIELDFENLGNDTLLWEAYAAFISLMQSLSLEAGLQLQVVLEPSALGQTSFPEGPQYVVMFYNLFGNHSGPGPKADLSFVINLADKTIKSLPGKPMAAFATGGYAWVGQGVVQELSEKAAMQLIKKHGVKARRDPGSQALTFEYTNKEQSYQVWFADGHTISCWASEVAKQGIMDIYIWKLGSNAPVSLEMITKTGGF